MMHPFNKRVTDMFSRCVGHDGAACMSPLGTPSTTLCIPGGMGPPGAPGAPPPGQQVCAQLMLLVCLMQRPTS